MNPAQTTLQDEKISVKLKLAALWASLMFLYLYVDYFALYMPGKLDGILRGKIFVFEITQTFLLSALVSVSIPALMISLSVILPAKINRWVNLVIAAIYIPFTLYNLAGEAWLHMVFAAITEVMLLGLILVLAWKWQKMES